MQIIWSTPTGTYFPGMENLIHSAEDLGVDGILLSCTIFSPFIDRLRSCTDLPLVAADIGVFEKAVRTYLKIGAIVSFAPTLDSVAWVVDRCRHTIKPDLDIEIRFAEGAFEAAAAGDEEKHNQIIYETAEQFQGKDAIVLPQMSQVRALPLFADYPIPVLSSPAVSLGLLVEEIENRK